MKIGYFLYLFTLMLVPILNAGTALTVYNQNFGVLRETIPLTLSKGINEVSFSGVTSLLEPESVVLRDPEGAVDLSIVEQSYRGDPVDRMRLLQMFEGETIRFYRLLDDKEIVFEGRIIRAPSEVTVRNHHGGIIQKSLEPIIEVEGQLVTVLPGEPLFPSLGDDSILEPTLSWKLFSGESLSLDAQLSYLTSGMSWHADYNLVLPEKGDELTLTGWVSIENNTGTGFEDATVKLIAGDVNKVQGNRRHSKAAVLEMARGDFGLQAPEVTSEKFDEFHLYSLPLPINLRDGEIKQVEFVRAERVQTQKRYVYDGARVSYYGGLNLNQAYGQNSHPDVRIYREFVNDSENELGIALPAGRTRFYRADNDGQLEFTGENTIDHTPKNETIRVYLGNAFDIVGERTRMDFFKHPGRDLIRESFQIEIRNRSEEPVTVDVTEQLYRWSNWEVTKHSHDFDKLDAKTIEFPILVQPDSAETITYTVEYSW